MDDHICLAAWMPSYMQDKVQNMEFSAVCQEIAEETKRMMTFWKNAPGAPSDAAKLLSKSNLEWQSSLADLLPIWTGASTQGQLILAWAHLGSLIEGQMQLLLCIYYHDYKGEMIQYSFNFKDPDELMLERLRLFFQKVIWPGCSPWNDWVRHIQQRRNAIHAFKTREIGTFEEWQRDVRMYRLFIEDINMHLPDVQGYY